MSEEETYAGPNFPGIPLVFTPEQQEELQRKFNVAFKEYMEGLPEGLLTMEVKGYASFPFRKSEKGSRIVNTPKPHRKSVQDILDSMDEGMAMFDLLSADDQADLRHRFGEHKEDSTRPMAGLESAALEYAALVLLLCPRGRETSLAVTKLEEAVMWAAAAISREE
jgi:hypothetical protein